MKITLTGSLGNISKPLAEILISAGHEVTIISSSEDRAQAIRDLGAIPAIGSIEDITFLTNAFKDADAIYTMVPPNFATNDYRKYIASSGQHIAKAIQASGVTKVVNLSSIGAHLKDGTGPIKGLHDVELLLNDLDQVVVKHLRPAYFYINLYGNIGMIKHANIIGSNHNADTDLVLVHPDEIAAVAAEELQQPFTSNSIRYIASDEVKASELARVIGAAIGKAELPWVEFTNEQTFEGMVQAGLSEEVAKNYVEMGDAIRTGILFEDYKLHQPVLGKIKLADFAKQFAAVYAG